jgi:RNA polymerase sigma-70 factor (ECF subfamily)
MNNTKYRNENADFQDVNKDPDHALLQEIVAGDADAFERLFRAYYTPLCDYCQGIVGEKATAEDLVEDVFTYLWRQRDGMHVRVSLRAYLFTAARHASLNFLKRRAMERAHSPRLAEFITYLQETDYSDRELEDLDALRRAIAELPPRCRRVFLMNSLEEKSYKEIAADLRLSVNTVKTHLAKAYRFLRSRLPSRPGIFLFFLSRP